MSNGTHVHELSGVAVSLLSTAIPLPVCDEHPDSLVRRYRGVGPGGPGVYPQCVPSHGAPHLLAWPEAAPVREPLVEVHALSPSERVVLDDAGLGLTVGETARKRQKGVETVKSQRRSILLKLGARNMAHAVAMVLLEEEHDQRHAA
jgi:DNA-binding NarL/FixJ family response regulator